MNTQQRLLDKMDEQADKAIASWSLGAVMVNMLPPALAPKALFKVVYEISEDLSQIYDCQKNAPVFKNMALAVVKDLRKAYEAEPQEVTQSHLDQLKYIPGINIWVGLMMQSHTAEAVTHSVGHAIKEFFHAQRQNRVMNAEAVADIAAKSFRDCMTSVSDAQPGALETDRYRF